MDDASIDVDAVDRGVDDDVVLEDECLKAKEDAKDFRMSDAELGLDVDVAGGLIAEESGVATAATSAVDRGTESVGC